MSQAVPAVRQQYESHIEKQKSSGLSIKSYCSEHNLSPDKFSYYRNYKSKPKQVTHKTSSFASVKLQSSSFEAKKDIAYSKKPKIDPVWLGQLINSLLEAK